MGKRILTLLVGCGIVALLLFLVARPVTQPTALAPGQPMPILADLHAVDDLKAQFNHDVGVPRLILLVSPT